jgi:hypothetical protein
MKARRRAMPRSKVKKQRDPLPEQFNNLEDAVEFWDTHSLADYEEFLKEVQCEIDIKRRTYQVSVDSSLYQKLRHAARARCFSRDPRQPLAARKSIIGLDPISMADSAESLL